MDFNKLYTILIFILSINISAQDTPGNLQFNSIKTLSLEDVESSDVSGNGRIFIMGNITVPSGKVWKITSSSLNMRNSAGWITHMTGSSSNSNNTVYGILRIGGQVVKEAIFATPTNIDSSPIWLPSGTHEIRIDASYYLEYQLFYVSINAIEFNVVN
jgi:hypothetical protein